MEIMNPQVGGTRAGARAFEINGDGQYLVESRPDPHPEHSVFQYRILSPDRPVSRPPVFVQEAMFADGLR
jgi:hypothetical protein